MIVERNLGTGYNFVDRRSKVNIQNCFLEGDTSFDSWSPYVERNSNVVLVELTLVSPETVLTKLETVVARIL